MLVSSMDITFILYALPTILCLLSYGKYIYSLVCAVLGSGFYALTVRYTGFMNVMLPSFSTRFLQCPSAENGKYIYSMAYSISEK